MLAARRFRSMCMSKTPGFLTAPWNTVQRYDRVQQGGQAEFICAENRFNIGDLDALPEAKTTPDF
jgi:hypothetical protein